MQIQRAGFDAPTQVQKITKTITFAGGVGTGAVGTVTVFTITGLVYMRKILPYCSSDLVSAGGGSISLGRSGAVTALIGATTATAVDNGQYWMSTTPAATILAIPAALTESLIGTNIIIDVTTGDVTAGVINFYMEYQLLSSTAAVS